MQSGICPTCGRDFLASSCLEHCEPACCRRASCINAKPATRNPARRLRQCIVCHRTDARIPWERFAPCDSNCQRIYFASSRSDPSRAEVARKFVCEGIWGSRPELHRPAAKPRIHVLYCSVRCYSHSSLGHDARKREGIRRRNRRYWAGRGSKSAYITEHSRAQAQVRGMGREPEHANTKEGRDIVRRAAERANRAAEVEAFRAKLTERFLENKDWHAAQVAFRTALGYQRSPRVTS